MAKNISIFGIYPDPTSVSDAIRTMRQVGYRATDIASLLPDNQGSKDFAHVKNTKAGQGAATGAAVGAVLCALLAWLDAVGKVAIPGLQPFLPVNSVVAALAGAGVGALLGWLIGFFVGLGMSEYVAKRYVGRIRRGGILVSVHCDSPEWCDRAKKALKDTGAQDISSCSESAADYATTDRPTERKPAGLGDRVYTTEVRPVAFEGHIRADEPPAVVQGHVEADPTLRSSDLRVG
jgi:hypothetical protein